MEPGRSDCLIKRTVYVTEKLNGTGILPLIWYQPPFSVNLYSGALLAKGRLITGFSYSHGSWPPSLPISCRNIKMSYYHFLCFRSYMHPFIPFTPHTHALLSSQTDCRTQKCIFLYVYWGMPLAVIQPVNFKRALWDRFKYVCESKGL